MARSRPDIIRGLFAAYLANDRVAVERLFTADFRFTSPFDDWLDKPSYFERCWRGSDWIESHELETILAEGDRAFVSYRCTAKGGKSFRNVELFDFDGDRIRRIEVFFGASYQDGRFLPQPER
jgi:ketosteroid isomerase-like protein